MTSAIVLWLRPLSSCHLSKLSTKHLYPNTCIPLRTLQLANRKNAVQRSNSTVSTQSVLDSHSRATKHGRQTQAQKDLPFVRARHPIRRFRPWLPEPFVGANTAQRLAGAAAARLWERSLSARPAHSSLHLTTPDAALRQTDQLTRQRPRAVAAAAAPRPGGSGGQAARQRRRRRGDGGSGGGSSGGRPGMYCCARADRSALP